MAFEKNLARCRTIQPQKATADGGLATAAFPDQSQGFTSLYSEADIVNSLYIGDLSPKKTLGYREVHLQVFHF
jgi:hypothetical protein